jgi:hypothetical protein
VVNKLRAYLPENDATPSPGSGDQQSITSNGNADGNYFTDPSKIYINEEDLEYSITVTGQNNY